MIGEDSILNQRYKLEKKIGQGGFARVFRATDIMLKRPVAIKVLNDDLSDDEGFLHRFEHEAQAVASLSHPNILGVFDYGLIEQTAYLVMPYIEGGTLHDRIRQEKFLPLPLILTYIHQISLALDHAHRRNIVHRDIKPQNMLLEAENNHLLLSDFGIAKVLSASSVQSKTGITGTVAYMSPEQLTGNVHLSSDIYSLGCVVFQLLTGTLPYYGATGAVMFAHISSPVPSIIERSQGRFTATVQDVIEHALAKKPEDRFQTAGELANALKHSIVPMLPPGSYDTLPSGTWNFNTNPTVTGYGSPSRPPSTPTGPGQNYPPLSRTPGQSTSPGSYPPGNFGPPSNPFQPVPPISPTGGLPINPPSRPLNHESSPRAASIPGQKEPNPVQLQTPPGGLSAPHLTNSGIAYPSAVTLMPHPKVVRRRRIGWGWLVGGLVALIALVGLGVFAWLTLFAGELDEIKLQDANQTFFVKSDLAGGLAKLRDLSQRYPNNARVWRDYGHALNLWKREGDGNSALQRAVQLDPKDSLAYLYLTNSLIDSYKFSEAQTAANTTAQLDPTGWKGYAARALYFAYTLQFSQSHEQLALMQKAAGADSSDPYYNWVLGNIFMLNAKGDYPDFATTNKLAYGALDKTLETWPTFPQVYALRAYLFALSDFTFSGERGISVIQEAIKAQPEVARYNAYLAYLYRFKANDFTNAEKYARTALQLNPSDSDALISMGGVLGARKDFANAYKRYESCVQINPYQDQCYNDWAYYLGDDSWELSLRGRNNESQELRKQGLEKAQKALSFAPNHADYMFRVGYFYYFLGDFKSAIDILQKSDTGHPNQALTLAYLGLAYFDNGQKDQAKQNYDKAVKLNPDDFFVKRLGDKLAGR